MNQDKRKIRNSVKTNILIKQKFLRADDLLLLFLPKKKFFFLGVGRNDLSLVQTYLKTRQDFFMK